MTLDEVLRSLFPKGHKVGGQGACVVGAGQLPAGGEIAVVGIVDGQPLSPDDVLVLGQAVLDVVEAGGDTPILVLVDTQGQVMSRHAEMIGLNEYCAHLAKCLLLASREGHRTIGFEYGGAAAGAFLATALATDVLVAVEDAKPEVMDLPSMARVTKLPLEKLKKLAKTTPVFSPGVDPLFKVGAVTTIWDAKQPLAEQLAAALADASREDRRGALGKERGGRTVSADVVRRVIEAAGAMG